MTGLLSIIVALIGLLLYAFASNAKLAEVGRIMFGCGLLVALFELGGRAVSLLGR